MRKQELYLFIGVIILVVIIFFIFLVASFFSSPESPQPSSLPTSQPSTSISSPSLNNFPPAQSSPFPSPSSDAVILNGLTKEQLVNMLPLRTVSFNIEYYYDGDIFKVTIKENPYTENRTGAEEWFKNLGFEPKDLNIYWDAFPEVRR